MIDFDRTTPCFYWWGGGEEHADPLGDYVIGESVLRFDYPTGDPDDPPEVVAMKKTETGLFRWVGPGPTDEYLGVRGETRTHVVVSGTWVEEGYEGVFILVLPKPRP